MTSSVNKRRLVPGRRFPEFRDAEEWVEQNFYDLLIEVLDFRGRTPKKLGMDWGGGNIVSLSANNVKNGYIDFDAECNLGSDALYEKWMGKVNLEQGDIVFTMEAPLGNALLVPDSDKYILSQRVVAFKTKPDVNNLFLIQLIWSSRFHGELTKLSTGSTAKGINQKTLQKINVRIPQDKIEQQKIADCLTSVDELITAQTQKLDTLKTHKIGLMQQLFPAEGETLPKRRFPEFRGKGKWEESTLVELAKFRRGSFPQPYGLPEWYDENNGMPFVQVFDVDDNLRLKNKTKNKISKLGAEQSVFIPKGTLIVTLQGSIGRVAVTQYDAYVDRTLLLFESFLRPTEMLFFAYVIQNLFEIEKGKAPGGIIKTITKEVLSDFKVKLPSLPEQQKSPIASPPSTS